MKSEDDYVAEIRNAISCGDERYWVHGYRSSHMRAVKRRINIEFEGVQLRELDGPTDLDICVFCLQGDALEFSALEAIARKRKWFIDGGKLTGLPI